VQRARKSGEEFKIRNEEKAKVQVRINVRIVSMIWSIKLSNGQLAPRMEKRLSNRFVTVGACMMHT
jgi:hypothetical protein